MSNSSRCGSELDTAAGIRPLPAIGSVFAEFMCAVVTFAMIAMPSNYAAHRDNLAAVDKILAVARKGVDDRDQCPDDDQNPSYSRQGGFAQFCLYR
jgi:hypothetical protein